MSNWVPITTPDLQDARIAALVEALQTAGLAEGQSDPTPAIVQKVVDYIRRKIASNAANQVDEDETTIPRGLKADAIALIIAAMKARLDGYDLTQDERDEKRRIEADLNRIAEGKESVEQPDDAIDSPAQATGGRPRIEARRRKYSRRDAEGL